MSIKKTLWFSLGCILLGVAFVGVYLPGLPWSTPAVGAAYCFAKSSDRMHNWIMNHKLFGPFLRNWGEKRVFPQKMKYFMLGMMSLSLVLMYVSGVKTIGIISTACFMAIVAVWAWRYPSSVEEHDRRKETGEKIGWLK